MHVTDEHPMVACCLIALVLVLSFAATTAAEAVGASRWKGGDIEFKVERNQIKKISLVAVHTCQVVGTGEFFNELQRFTPRGRFKLRRGGRVAGSRYVMRVNDYFDVRFAWRGRLRRGRFGARVQTSYKYYAFYNDYGHRLTSCYSERIYSARRKR